MSQSRSRSRSPVRARSRSRSRSRSPVRARRNGGGGGGGGPPRGSVYENPPASRCLGIFGLSLYTTERDLRDIFEQYGPLEKIQLVVDHPSGRSRGFGFIYFEKMEDAMEAKERAAGLELDGHKVRIDFSVTKRAHSPTPGIYMGAAGTRRFPPRRRYDHRSPSPRRDRYRSRDYRESNYDRSYRSRRSPSPRYDDRRYRRRSRSYEYY
ncbi:hypothetical protein QR680_015152 [Steinernema hermaphroditum]|uniref:RRM domain-containing protein n=1 Tax=Steinernema hermaphroditum TaxID=289476 RepID=A0AA39M4F3_9BILA|nr:hypothetical protein QR680_015152 [Steinernema hermaphroditum]